MLFRKPKKVLPALTSDEEMDIYTGINYENVLEWLVGLSGDDYTKVCQIAAVYRQADFEAAKVLGVDNEPVTFITPPTEPDTIDQAFLDMPEKPAKTSKKITVKE